jgi:glycosyltransferase involved in cell wall biosynthesis
MNQKKVSICIPTYNRSSFLKNAIDSALSQTHTNLEIIVSNNGSNDDTEEVLLNFSDERLVVLNHEENLGMLFNFNYCLKAATGEFFLLLSDDDILEIYAVEELLAGFINDSIAVSYGRVLYLKEGDNKKSQESYYAPRVERGDKLLENILKNKRVVYPSATMFRTMAGKNLGGYPNVGLSTDFGILALLSINNYVFFCSKVLVQYRLHKDNLSLSEDSIISQKELFYWVNSNSNLKYKLMIPLKKYCLQNVYNMGKYYAFKGDKDKSALAESILNSIDPNIKWFLLFKLFNSKFIRLIYNTVKG